jgi:hypothetical protein
MLSIYDSNSSIDDRIHYLKFYETYDGVATNQKLHQILIEYKSKYSEVMEKIIDAILYTRNIHSGRGLRDLTYSYLLTLQNFIPMKAVFILYMLVNNNIGSWRDIRTYCEFLAKEKGRNEPFIRPIICLYNHQLLKDHAAFNAGKPISYAAKWVPRETKGRGWLFDILVSLYDDPEYKAIRADATDAAMRKCKMMYRKMVSKLNKHLDTLEIKQCANEWATIDPASLSTSQLYNGANAFTRTGTEDRAKCASTFDAEYKKRLEQITQKKYSYNVPIWKLVKHIVRLIGEKKTEELDAMNLHWNSYVENRFSKNPDYYIAILDVSESMPEKELYTTIGMCCAVATKSYFGKNVLVVGETPEWVELTGCKFSEMVQRIMSPFWNKYAVIPDAFKMVLDAVISANMTPEDVENLKIQLYTKQQIDYESIFQMWKNKSYVLSDRNLEKISL